VPNKYSVFYNILTIRKNKESYPQKNLLLLMGPCFDKHKSQLTGGPIISFGELLKELDINKVQYILIDTNKNNYKNIIIAYLSISFQLFSKFNYSYHISLHSSKDYILFAPLIVLLGKIFNKKTSIRKFGGELKDTYIKSNFIKKYYLKVLFSHVDTLLLQTKYLVSFFSKINKKTIWFPNARSRVIEPNLPRKFQKKFVFISHVIKEKGIHEIIAASQMLDKSYTIEVYGPIFDKSYEELFYNKINISYKGVLPSHKVLETLNTYDVVLLPSYKEGYPGIIIEAYSLGIPVIVTNLPSICEIVESYKTGILVTPKNVQEIVSAIQFFNTTNYTTMSQYAYQAFNHFRSDLNAKRFIKMLKTESI